VPGPVYPEPPLSSRADGGWLRGGSARKSSVSGGSPGEVRDAATSSCPTASRRSPSRILTTLGSLPARRNGPSWMRCCPGPSRPMSDTMRLVRLPGQPSPQRPHLVELWPQACSLPRLLGCTSGLRDAVAYAHPLFSAFVTPGSSWRRRAQSPHDASTRGSRPDVGEVGDKCGGHFSPCRVVAGGKFMAVRRLIIHRPLVGIQEGPIGHNRRHLEPSCDLDRPGRRPLGGSPRSQPPQHEALDLACIVQIEHRHACH
jgi:hypothetical protein